MHGIARGNSILEEFSSEERIQAVILVEPGLSFWFH
jgi:hypothetical protein